VIALAAARHRQLDLADWDPRSQATAPAHQICVGLQPSSQGDQVGDAVAMAGQDGQPVIVAAVRRHVVTAKAEVVAELVHASREDRGGEVVRRHQLLLSPEGIAHDDPRRPRAGVHGQVAQLEAAWRQRLAAHQVPVDEDIRGGRRGDRAGEAHRWEGHEVGIDGEFPREAEPPEDGAATQPARIRREIAHDPAEQALAIVDGDAGEPAHDVAVLGARDRRQEEAATYADAELGSGGECVEVHRARP
jgi:hypothetical protein